MVERRCDYCGITYSEDAFHVAVTTKKKVYRRRKCRDCYRQTKQLLIDKHYRWLNEYKQKKGCAHCGVTDPRVLDFHHLRSEDKSFTIAHVRREVGFEKLTKEMEKCVIVCANCHRILHDEEKTGRSGT